MELYLIKEEFHKEGGSNLPNCALCNVTLPEDDFQMYSEHRMTTGRIITEYVCKECSDSSYGTDWYPITGYDQVCEISKQGEVRELKNGRYYNITRNQGPYTFAYLSKNGKEFRKHTLSLMRKFITD